MNHASGVVTPENAEMAQVGDAVWQRAERRGLAHGSTARGPRLLRACSDAIAHVSSYLTRPLRQPPPKGRDPPEPREYVYIFLTVVEIDVTGRRDYVPFE
jgi:hypothetical protein